MASKKIFARALALALCAWMWGGAPVSAQQTSAQQTTAQTGQISGKLLDGQTGDPLVGGGVYLEGIRLGAMADLNGDFTIQSVPVGTYTLVAAYVGYTQTRVTGVTVAPGRSSRYDLALQPEAFQMEEVVVEATAVRNNDASLLRERQKAVAVSDAIGAREISRGGMGDAAAAMSRVTGASVLGSRYVYIRGLGERYTLTRLNGAFLPSSDPDKQAVHLDMFPSNLLENIVTTKTATPDKPGNFTGGSVNISTRSFPDDLTMSLSATATYNSETTWQDNFLSAPEGMTSWLADGASDMGAPAVFDDTATEIPNIGTVYRNAANAAALDSLSNLFSTGFAPVARTAPVGRSFAFSVGNRYLFLGKPLGFLGSLTYGRTFSTYSDGESGRYQLTGPVAVKEELTTDYALADSKSSDEVTWGGMATFSYKLDERNELGVNYTRTQSGETVARYQMGIFPRDLSEDARYESRVVHYTERVISSTQVRGEHYLPSVLNSRINWTATRSSTEQDEPDVRYFSNDYTVFTRNGVVDTLYSITPSLYPVPIRYYRDMQEDATDLSLDVEIPFTQWNDLPGKAKFGGNTITTERDFAERAYRFPLGGITYDGSEDSFFEENTGIVGYDNRDRPIFGAYVVNATDPKGSYTGEQTIHAGYGMVDVPILPGLKLIGGVRFETTDISVTSLDTTQRAARLENNDLLPSVNAVYQLRENMNIRAAYSQTVARPTFRELAPYESFNFIGGFVWVGNDSLQRTLTHNYDLRWEWFTRPGEILAASVFYKSFRNPIERIIVTGNGQIQYQNVPKSRVYGAEFEFRKNLDGLASWLSQFQIGANLTLVNSEVSIPESEMIYVRAVDPDASNERPLQGQSPYVFNIDVSYDNQTSGSSANLHYNLFGRRLSMVSLYGTPDVYEESRGVLDFSMSQRVFGGVSLKLGVKNILNSEVAQAHTYKGEKYYYGRYTPGRSFSLGLNYSIGG